MASPASHILAKLFVVDSVHRFGFTLIIAQSWSHTVYSPGNFDTYIDYYLFPIKCARAYTYRRVWSATVLTE